MLRDFFCLDGQSCQSPSQALSEHGQLLQAILHFHVERRLHEWTPIAGLESQHNERRAYEDQFLCFFGQRCDHQRMLVIQITAFTLASDSALTIARLCAFQFLRSSHMCLACQAWRKLLSFGVKLVSEFSVLHLAVWIPCASWIRHSNASLWGGRGRQTTPCMLTLLRQSLRTAIEMNSGMSFFHKPKSGSEKPKPVKDSMRRSWRAEGCHLKGGLASSWNRTREWDFDSISSLAGQCNFTQGSLLLLNFTKTAGTQPIWEK